MACPPVSGAGRLPGQGAGLRAAGTVVRTARRLHSITRDHLIDGPTRFTGPDQCASNNGVAQALYAAYSPAYRPPTEGEEGDDDEGTAGVLVPAS